MIVEFLEDDIFPENLCEEIASEVLSFRKSVPGESKLLSA